MRWIAHLLLSLGTLASFAITLPLVFGWMHFAAGRTTALPRVFGLHAAGRAASRSTVPFAWLMFHALASRASRSPWAPRTSCVARLRRRAACPARRPASHVAPLLLLLVVALTGLALPASRTLPAVFQRRRRCCTS